MITSHVPLRNLAFSLSCSLEQLALQMLQISSALFSLLIALSASLGSLEEAQKCSASQESKERILPTEEKRLNLDRKGHMFLSLYGEAG